MGKGEDNTGAHHMKPDDLFGGSTGFGVDTTVFSEAFCQRRSHHMGFGGRGDWTQISPYSQVGLGTT